MPLETTEKSDSTKTIKNFRNLVGRISDSISTKSKVLDNGKSFQVQAQKNGKFTLSINPETLTQDNSDVILLKALSEIEMLKTETGLMADEKSTKQLKKYRENLKSPVFQVFYSMIFQAIAAHKGAMKVPILHQKLTEIGKRIALSLPFKGINAPLHIQFLIALMGHTEGINDRVREYVDSLKTDGIIDDIFRSSATDSQRMSRINNFILPIFKYFLKKDLKEWNKPLEDTKKQTKEKVKEQMEQGEEGQETEGVEEESEGREESEGDQQSEEGQETEGVKEESEEGQKTEGVEEESEGGQETEDEQQQGETEQSEQSQQSQPSPSDEEQSTPDHQQRYKTPDHQESSYEEDPKRKGYRLEISPPYAGYYVSDRKNFYDTKDLEFEYSADYQPYTSNPDLIGKKHTIHGKMKGHGIKSIPIPNGYALDINSVNQSPNLEGVYRDQNGNFFVKITGKVDFSIDFYKEKSRFIAQPVNNDAQEIYSGSLSAKAETAISQARNIPGNPVDQATIIRDYIRQNHSYPQGKTEKDKLNAAHKTQSEIKKASNPSNYIQNLDAAEFIECYSANTLMVAMCRKLGIPSRIVVGHMVDQVNENGNAEINSANCHGWTEIWNGKEWVRLDATPPERKEDKEEKEDEKDENDEDQKNQEMEKADDGGVDNDDQDKDDEDKEDQDSEKSDESESNEGDKTGGDQDQESDESDEIDDDEDEEIELEEPEEAEEEEFDPEKEFEKMYKEMQEFIDPPPSEETIQEASESMQEEEEEEEEEEEVDPLDLKLQRKYPQMPDWERKSVIKEIKNFKNNREQLLALPNPLANDDPENPMLADVLRSIFDRVISRSMYPEETPQYPVYDGEELVDPVTLHLDELEGKAESLAWKTTVTEQKEKMKVVKVRRRKILDASPSMRSGGGRLLKLQQQIEAIDNTVTAEKQEELEELSTELDRDLLMETETWQFGINTQDPNKDYRVIKPLSSKFDDVDQAIAWKLAGEVGRGTSTNDFNPLESIHQNLLAENREQQQEDPDAATVLERIKTGFCIRELNNWEELKTKDDDELTQEQQIYKANLEQKVEEYQEFLEQMDQRFEGEIEPIVEVIEVSTDGASNDYWRVQIIIDKLRKLGVVVIAYGLGREGQAAINTYYNPYNPSEGGMSCVNILDYPRRKMEAWSSILDKI
ncbi:transglutaminase family protein [Patescibacteria group bacterium]